MLRELTAREMNTVLRAHASGKLLPACPICGAELHVNVIKEATEEANGLTRVDCTSPGCVDARVLTSWRGYLRWP